MLLTSLLLALQAIRRNLLRSTLTMLGIVIGVSAVIVMVTLGGGATEAVSAQISSLGTSLLTLRPGRRMGPAQTIGAAPFTVSDVEAIRRTLPALLAVAPASSRSATAILGNDNWSTQVVGTDGEYLVARQWNLEAGRIFSASELRAGAPVCIVGATVRNALFGSRTPVGSRIRLEKLSCEIIGLLEEKGEAAMGADQDDVVLTPLRTFHRRIAGNQEVASIQVAVRDSASMDRVRRELETLMRERRHLSRTEDNDFSVMDPREIMSTLTGTTRTLTALLGAVAAVSLLVGGIGIMNIMLVSVTERTREIGIRLAIGALGSEVLLQFLVEALVLSSCGGLIGIALGIAGSAGAAAALDVPFVFNATIVLLALLFSGAIGVFFGYFPAHRAAQLDPIEALRRE